ncbi:heme-binding HmuY-like protein [Larkinella arboricola]|uniref:Heme-binding HmuY-like protein n=1 Tax=Larkinella arboricola TaxID=643671 RepID=A0A327X8B1_LARAB|nr:heme-binding HmuY-like protein [Larkinella arboricola]
MSVTYQPVRAQAVKVETVHDLPADPANNDPQSGRPLGATNRFTFFSLKDGKQVPNSDSATANWDIGFRSTTIIVNGGTGRAGKGGAYIHNGTFESLTAVPENAAFSVDQSLTQLAIPAGSGNGWYTYGGGVIAPTPEKVLVIRTADGKYAKLEVLGYYKGGPDGPGSESRYYTFRYAYQPDGSRKLD